MSQRTERFLTFLYLLGLLLWGVYVVLMFLGVDSHIVVLLEDESWRTILEHTDSVLLRGASALFPFFQHLLSQFKPFAGYAIVSLLLYGAYVGYTVLRTGKLYLSTQVSVVYLLLLSLGSLWLLFTTLFFATLPGMQQRLLIEPMQEIYTDAGEEGLLALEENFQHLLKVGCLREDSSRRAKGGATVYSYLTWCSQKHFITRVLPPLGMLLFLSLNFLVLGRFLLRILKLAQQPPFIEFLISLGVGAAVMIILLWFLALFHSFHTGTAWVLLVVIPLVGYRQVLHWLRASWRQRWTVQCSFIALPLILTFLLVSYLMLNYLSVVRPFPIGWDDLGKYLNAPRQMSTFGVIIPGMLAMQWEYLTSLGFVLFGYSSTFGAVLAQEINWMAGLFAVLAVLGCAKVVLSNASGDEKNARVGLGLLAALFYYTLPMVGHFSFADMKTENALFAFGVLGLLCIYLFLSQRSLQGAAPPPVASVSKNSAGFRIYRWLFIAGVLLAAAFATKPTVVFLALMGGIILTYDLLGSVAGGGSIFLALWVMVKLGGLSVPETLGRVTGISTLHAQEGVVIISFVVGILLLFFPLLSALLRQRDILWERWNIYRYYSIAALFLCLGFLSFSAPWMVRNMVLNGHATVSASLAAPNTIMPRIEYTEEAITPMMPPGSRGLPIELALDPNHEMCRGTAKAEELDRYWGYQTGFMHYAGLPWRLVMNTDAQGYYLITSPLLLLTPLLLFLPAFWRRQPLKLLFWGTLFGVFLWLFIANGIPWYGIGIFFGLAVFVEAMLAYAPSRATQYLAGVLIFLSLATAFSFRLWQFGIQQNLYEYAWGKASAAVLREMTIPEYNNIAEQVVKLSRNPDRPYLYRMGTFISYFIPRNLEVITQNDNQLVFFNCLNQEGNHQLTLKRLQVLGFHSMVFDTNTATIERDPNGTLHQKVQRFVDFLNDPAVGVTAVVNNPNNGIVYVVLP